MSCNGRERLQWVRSWFERGLNNARLASVATYETLAPLFDRLPAGAQGDLGVSPGMQITRSLPLDGQTPCAYTAADGL